MKNVNKIIVISAMILVIAISTISCKSRAKYQGEPIVTNLIEKDFNDYETVIKDHAGKILVVNFFASWCPPCKTEAPGFTRVYNEYKDKNFMIVAFSIDEDKQDAIDFVNYYGFEFPVYMATKSMQNKYNVEKVPTTIIYSPEGTVLDIIPGALSESLLRSYAKIGSN